MTSHSTKRIPQGWNIEFKETLTSLAHSVQMEQWEHPTVWAINAKDSCIVLGSSEREKAFLDFTYLDREGLNLATRRSGGGAVLVEPDHLLWLDVFVPNHSLFWVEDVKLSALWMGRIWHETLQEFSVECSMYEGKFRRSPLSDLVCFAGQSPGEIFIQGQKVLGISQRRSKHGTRYQCALVLKWSPRHLINLFHSAPIEDLAKRIQGCGTAINCRQEDVLETFLSHLPNI